MKKVNFEKVNFVRGEFAKIFILKKVNFEKKVNFDKAEFCSAAVYFLFLYNLQFMGKFDIIEKNGFHSFCP